MSAAEFSSSERQFSDPLGAAAVHAGFPPPIAPEQTLDAGQWGMIAFLVSEVALFGTLLMTYATFIGADTVGPTPREVLSLPLVIGMTVCLLSSSLTIHLAEKGLHQERIETGTLASFSRWWIATILLGAAFLAGTAYEWRELIEEHGLTISRNLFGTTYYTLIGFHALHVTIGLGAMAVMLGLSFAGQFDPKKGARIQLVSWYWHFVDALWIAVFSLVYIIGR